MSNKHDWLNKKYPRSIDQLRLWNENPRLNPEERHLTVSDFVEDLIEDDAERKNFFGLMKSIVKEFIPADPIVVWQDESNKKFYVAEGNRRVLVLKLLRDPSKAPKSIRSYVRGLEKEWEPFDKILVNVAPSFEDAEWYINQRNNASSLQRPWSRLQQQRWIISLYKKYGEDYALIELKTGLSRSEIESIIRNLHFIELIKCDVVRNALSEEEYADAISYRFPITILERFFDSSEVKKNWGIDYNGTNVILKNRSGFLVSYAQFIKNVVSKSPDIKIDTRTITSNLDKILDDLPPVNLSEIDEVVVGTNPESEMREESNTGESKEKPTPVEKNNPNRDKLILPIYHLKSEEHRLNGIFSELQRMPVKRYTNAVAASIRIFLDLAVLVYLQSENLENECSKKYQKSFREVTLNSRLTFLAETSKIKGTKSASIISKLTNKDNEFSLDVLNGYQHSKDTCWLSKEFVNSFWDFLFPLFQKMLDIKEDS